MSGQRARRAGAVRAVVVLLVVVLTATLLVTVVHEWSAGRIAASRAHHTYADIRLVLPQGYDNRPDRDRITLRAPDVFGNDEPVEVFRARRDARPFAIALVFTTTEGYNAPIRLCLGLDHAGRVTGVSVLEQHETEGLGAAIDRHYSRWLEQFRGRSLSDPETDGWRTEREGGTFDGLSGATVSARAVIRAVHAGLVFYRDNRKRLFAQ